MSWKEEARKKLKQRMQGASWKPTEGDNCVRIMPNKTKGETPYFEYLLHRNVGPDQKMLRCGHDMDGGGDCWLCDVVIPKLEGNPNHAKAALAANLKAKESMVVQVAYLDDGELRGPKPWFLSLGGGKSMGVKLQTCLTSLKRDYEDLKRGYNINFTRTGTTFTNTDYGPFEADQEPSAVPAEIVAKIKPLEELAGIYSEAAQRAAYMGAKAPETAIDEGEQEQEGGLGDEDYVDPDAPAEDDFDELPAEDDAEPADTGEEWEPEPEEEDPAPPPRRPASASARRPAPAAAPARRPAPAAAPARRPQPAAQPARRQAPPPPKKRR